MAHALPAKDSIPMSTCGINVTCTIRFLVGQSVQAHTSYLDKAPH